MKITVKEVDLDGALPCKSSKCLLARAIQRELNAQNVAVVTYSVVIDGTWYDLGLSAIQLRMKYDVGHYIDLPCEVEITRMSDQPA